MLRLGTLICATHNPGKLAEFRRMLGPFGVEVISASQAGLPEPVETAGSFFGNARLKAMVAWRATGSAAIADDSGLCVDVLAGGPGIDTAELILTAGGRDAHVGIERLAQRLRSAGAAFPTAARFVAALVLIHPDGWRVEAMGEVRGRLVWPPRGPSGHGFDPVFEPAGEGRIFGQMSSALKDALSHRGRALRALAAHCFT